MLQSSAYTRNFGTFCTFRGFSTILSIRTNHSLKTSLLHPSMQLSPVPLKTALSLLCQKPINRKFCSPPSSIPEISYNQLIEVLNSKSAVVIDVRNPEELVKFGEIPGAINIPLGDLEVRQMSEILQVIHCILYFQSALSMRPKKLEKLFDITLDERTPLVFSCMAGIRSKKAVVVAWSHGFTNVSDFAGGWLEWNEKQNSQ